MINVSISRIILSPVPSANQVVTIDYRCLGTSDAYTLLANNVVVQPNGQLVTPFSFQFDETVCTNGINLRAQANCGGGIYNEDIVYDSTVTTTTTSVPEVTTTTSSTTSSPEVTTTTSSTTVAPEVTTTTSSTTAAPEVTTTTSSTTAAPEVTTTTSSTTEAPVTTTSTTTPAVEITTSTTSSTTQAPEITSTSTSTTQPEETTTTTTSSTTQPPITTTSTTTVIYYTCPECQNYPGYRSSQGGAFCYKMDVVAATVPTTDNVYIPANKASQYSVLGSFIYNPGYAVSGRGTGSYIDKSNSFWVNGQGDINLPGSDTTKGPMNRNSIWATQTLDNQEVGFTACFTLEETKTYYVGVGTDNHAIIKVDGQVIVDQSLDIAGLDDDFLLSGRRSTFYVWHIYPVTLTAGEHIMEVVGKNIELIAAMAVEIYDNTEAELRAATSYAGLNTVLRSQDRVGQPIQVGTAGTGYSCPEGYALDLCHGAPRCVLIDNVPCEEMGAPITTTVTTTMDCPDVVNADSESAGNGCHTYVITNYDETQPSQPYSYRRCDGVLIEGILEQPNASNGHAPPTVTVCSQNVPIVNLNYDVRIRLVGNC